MVDKRARLFRSRWLATVLIPVMLGAAALTTGTGAVIADSTDDAFIARMHELGFTWSTEDEPRLIAVGHRICAARQAGHTPDAIAQDLHTNLGAESITFADVTSMVSAAESHFCSD